MDKNRLESSHLKEVLCDARGLFYEDNILQEDRLGRFKDEIKTPEHFEWYENSKWRVAVEYFDFWLTDLINSRYIKSLKLCPDTKNYNNSFGEIHYLKLVCKAFLPGEKFIRVYEFPMHGHLYPGEMKDLLTKPIINARIRFSERPFADVYSQERFCVPTFVEIGYKDGPNSVLYTIGGRIQWDRMAFLDKREAEEKVAIHNEAIQELREKLKNENNPDADLDDDELEDEYFDEIDDFEEELNQHLPYHRNYRFNPREYNERDPNLDDYSGPDIIGSYTDTGHWIPD